MQELHYSTFYKAAESQKVYIIPLHITCFCRRLPMRKKKPHKPRKKPTPKAAPAIHVTINVVAKKKPDNSKATLLLLDKYIAERQGIIFSKLEMK